MFGFGGRFAEQRAPSLRSAFNHLLPHPFRLSPYNLNCHVSEPVEKLSHDLDERHYRLPF